MAEIVVNKPTAEPKPDPDAQRLKIPKRPQTSIKDGLPDPQAKEKKIVQDQINEFMDEQQFPEEPKEMKNPPKKKPTPKPEPEEIEELEEEESEEEEEEEPTEEDEEDEEEEEPEETEEPDEEEEDEEDTDEDSLNDMDRSALKAYIKENELDITVYKSMKDDDIREAIREAAGEETEEEDSTLKSSREMLNIQAKRTLASIAATQQAAPAPEPEPDPEPDFTEEELAEAQADPAKFAALINKVTNKKIQKVQATQSQVQAEAARIEKVTTNFYADNPDLVEYDSIVALTLHEYQQANPDEKDLVKQLEETEKQVRKELRLDKSEAIAKRENKSKPSKKVKPPKIRKPKSKRKLGKVPDKRSDQQKHMDDMLVDI